MADQTSEFEGYSKSNEKHLVFFFNFKWVIILEETVHELMDTM